MTYDLGECAPAAEDIGEVVFGVVFRREFGASSFAKATEGWGRCPQFFGREEFGAFVVEGLAVGLDVVEPDVVGAAGVGLGEEQDGGGDAGLGLEDAAGQGNDGVELLLLDEHFAQGLVRGGGAEEDAVRHDDGGAATGF
jgi:hypothetical protein